MAKEVKLDSVQVVVLHVAAHVLLDELAHLLLPEVRRVRPTAPDLAPVPHHDLGVVLLERREHDGGVSVVVVVVEAEREEYLLAVAPRKVGGQVHCILAHSGKLVDRVPPRLTSLGEAVGVHVAARAQRGEVAEAHRARIADDISFRVLRRLQEHELEVPDGRGLLDEVWTLVRIVRHVAPVVVPDDEPLSVHRLALQPVVCVRPSRLLAAELGAHAGEVVARKDFAGAAAGDVRRAGPIYGRDDVRIPLQHGVAPRPRLFRLVRRHLEDVVLLTEVAAPCARELAQNGVGRMHRPVSGIADHRARGIRTDDGEGRTRPLRMRHRFHVRMDALRLLPSGGVADRERTPPARGIVPKPHDRVGRKRPHLPPHLRDIFRRGIDQPAGRKLVRLHPRNERLAEATREPGHVGHVGGNGLLCVAPPAHGIRIQVNHVEDLREQLLPGSVVVVAVRPCVSARRVPERHQPGRRGMRLLDRRPQIFRTRPVEEIEELRAGVRPIDLRRAPRARNFDAGRRGSAERRNRRIGEVPQRKARRSAVQPARRIEDFVAEAKADDCVGREAPAVRARPDPENAAHVVAHAFARDRGEHRIARPVGTPSRALVVHAPVDGDSDLVEAAARASRQVEQTRHLGDR